MTTQFPPSTFPTMSLGAPANLAGAVITPSTPAPPSAADTASVYSAIQCCTSHDASVRRPAEEQLRAWEGSYADMHATGYLASLVSIAGSSGNVGSTINIGGGGGGVVDESVRLLAVILLKNGIPKAFGVQLPDAPNEEVDGDTLSRLRQERDHVRGRLPALLFSEANATCALHLQLALSNVALFDFPKDWPTLLEDLMGVASGRAGTLPVVGSGVDAMTLRLRAIKTLRLCLQSIRQRRVVVQKGGPKKGGGGAHPMLDMRNLGSIIGKAVSERKEMHGRACSILGSLAEGIVNHARGAIAGDTVGDAAAWSAECLLAAGHVKCMTELLPMVQINSASADPRTPVVQGLMQSLAGICDATKAYPAVSVPPSLSGVAGIHSEYTMKMDKIYRAALICCISSIRSLPVLFAPQIPALLPAVVEPILTLDAATLHVCPVKRLMDMTGLVRTVLMCAMYDESRPLAMGSRRNAVLAALTGSGGGGGGGDGGGSGDSLENDPGLASARATVTALLAEGTIERLCEALVAKFLRLHSAEIEEWETDPEGRYETDLAEKSVLEADSPRHCGGALLLALANREPDRVAKSLLELTQRVCQQYSADDVEGMLNREACYRALELCHALMVGRGQRRLNFSEWFEGELRPILQTDLGENSPVAMRAMQARAVQVVQAYATSLKTEEFAVAFQSIARLIVAQDLVTAFCAARCINYLALLHVKGTQENAELLAVREHSVFALGNAFALAGRSESEECLRVDLMCVSALVEANGLYLEPVLQAIAEQLPPLWERARDSVPIHSCLLSVLNHLIMKMGFTTVEHPEVQKVLFPLLGYCTDISVANRAESLLEDGLRLWMVTLVSSRLATMGASLTSMLPRLEAILRSGLEPHLSLKVLQLSAILFGAQVIEPLAPILRDMLLKLTTCIHSKEADDDAMDGDDTTKGTDRGITTSRDAIAALNFADRIMQLFPDLGLSICAPAITKIIAVLPDKKVMNPPLLEAVLGSFGRMLWMNPNSLDEIFLNDANQDGKIAFVVRQFIAVVTSVSVLVMLSAKAQKIVFVDQKGAALSLCSAVCRSPRVARVAGQEILSFTRQLAEIESKSGVDLDALVEASCGTTRKVVGDGPLGDLSERSSEILKSDPLLTVRLKDALENAEKAVPNV